MSVSPCARVRCNAFPMWTAHWTHAYPLLRRYGFVKPLLEFFGVRREQVTSGPGCARRFLIPEPVACANPSPAHAALLRREIFRALGTPLDGSTGAAAWVRPLAHRVVLLLRRRGARAITNFVELHAALVARLGGDAEVVVFDGGAPAEAFRLWHNAVLAVGAHGAGFTNMLAARAPFGVLEFNIDEIGVAFQHLTIKLGFEYVQPLRRADMHSAYGARS